MKGCPGCDDGHSFFSHRRQTKPNVEERMRLTVRRLGLFSICLVIAQLNCAGDKADKVEHLFERYQSHGLPGAAVMVIHHGRRVLTRTYGLADLEERTPVTLQTNFRLASVSKQFTAMCIMMLAERGQLNYETTLADIFPDFPDYGKQITIAQLLHHTSELVAYEDIMPDTVTVQVHDADVLQMMRMQEKTYFAPGSEYRYSNSGYAVLAMIVEKVAAQPFAQFLQENIFTPLGMTHSLAYQREVSDVAYRAYGYTVSADSVRLTDQSPTSAVLGDGGIYSSLEDLTRWDQALYGEKLISRKSLQQAFTPALENYGFGWRVDVYKGHFRVHHTGSTRGFRNVIQRFPEDKLTIIILTNRDGESVALLADELADLYLTEN